MFTDHKYSIIENSSGDNVLRIYIFMIRVHTFSLVKYAFARN